MKRRYAVHFKDSSLDLISIEAEHYELSEGFFSFYIECSYGGLEVFASFSGDMISFVRLQADCTIKAESL